MRCAVFLLIFILLLSSGLQIYAQEKPEIGLVLSGGGAKGMAHIGILKELEALGIKPDYITGTSMGSIVGGLYAAGYSADEIEKISLEMNWDELLSNQIDLNHILYEEKQYYQRYLIELGVNGFSIELPKGLIEGQKLTELLSYLTRHVHNIDNFDDLPIPFACVGTDIVTGEPVVMRSGSLATALRASMAIPSVFTPVTRDGHYMVDGGLVRNFPVQECIDMGADIVIGVFVSDDLLPKDKLESAIDVLTQSAFVMSVFDSREQKEKCDLLIEPEMEPYTTFSFEEASGIIERGEEAAAKVRPQLMALADSLNFTPGYSVTRPVLQDTFKIARILVNNNENVPDEFVTARFHLNKDSILTILEIEKRVEALYGTRYFDKVTYTLVPDGEKSSLILNLDEAIPRQVKLAIHYDTENGAGLNVNFTTRDLLPASRALLEVDLAENFRVDANFLKYIRSSQNWAMKAGINYRNGEVPVGSTEIQNGIFKNDYLNPYLKFFSAAKTNYIGGITLQHERSVLVPKVAGEDLRILENLKWNSWSIEGEYSHNSFNKQFFPTSGTAVDLRLKYSFGADYVISYLDSTRSFDVSVGPDDFFSMLVGHTNRWRISNKLTLSLKDVMIMNFLRSSEESGYFPFFNDQVFTGGFRPLLQNSLPFWGANQYTFLTNSLFYNEVLIQYEPVKDIYLELASQYMNAQYPMQWIYDGYEKDLNVFFENHSSLWGYGLKISYMSIVGPVTFGVASFNKTSSWNTFFSIGFYF